MILRILIVLGLLILAWRVWRWLGDRRAETPPREAFEPTVRCCVCETYLPRERALERAGRHYCEHHAPD